MTLSATLAAKTALRDRYRVAAFRVAVAVGELATVVAEIDGARVRPLADLRDALDRLPSQPRHPPRRGRPGGNRPDETEAGAA